MCMFLNNSAKWITDIEYLLPKTYMANIEMTVYEEGSKCFLCKPVSSVGLVESGSQKEQFIDPDRCWPALSVYDVTST